MILRVFSGVPAPGGEEALLKGIHAYSVSTLEQLPALTGFQLGVRRGEAGEIVIATTWTDFASILASGDGQVNAPRSIGGGPAYFVASHADHYEVALGDQVGGPIPGASMRVTTVTLKPGLESTFFERSRNVAPELERSHGMLFHLVGRRAVGQYTEVCAITLWEPGALASEEQRAIPGTEDLASCFAAPPLTREFEPVVT